MSTKTKDRKKTPPKTKGAKGKVATKPLSARGKAKHAEATAKHRKPVDRALPGMEQPKDAILSRLCQSIHDQREVMNAAKQVEKGDIAAALQRMQSRGFQAFQDCGVELTRSPGAEKLRVRLVSEDGSAAVDSPDDDGAHDDRTSDRAEDGSGDDD